MRGRNREGKRGRGRGQAKKAIRERRVKSQRDQGKVKEEKEEKVGPEKLIKEMMR